MKAFSFEKGAYGCPRPSAQEQLQNHRPPTMHSPSRPLSANAPVWAGLLVAGLIAALSGCYSHVTYQRADDADSSSGIRYYQSAPYVLIYSDGKGGLNWQIVYMPDQTKLMTASPTTNLSKTQMNLSFLYGTLATGGATGDSTTLPNAVISAVQAAIPLLVSAAVVPTFSFLDLKKGLGTLPTPTPTPTPPPPRFPAPYLYKIVVDGSTVEFIGGQGTAPIRVPIANGMSNPIPVPTPAP